MTDHECDWPDTCNVCRGPVPKPAETVERYFTARYDGHCSDCDLPINAGTDVALLTTGRYVHGSCT
jgi:hypothetical protein